VVNAHSKGGAKVLEGTPSALGPEFGAALSILSRAGSAESPLNKGGNDKSADFLTDPQQQ